MNTGIKKRYQGVFLLIFINFLIFVIKDILHIPLTFLFLNNNDPSWYQLITALFCHANYTHLSGNMFFLYIFGRLIEEEEGMFGIFASYFICGIGANIVSIFFLHDTGYSLGASGAIFGLFTIAMLIKFKLNLYNILEILILAPFVIGHIINETKLVGNSDNIGHGVHISGAFVGVLLILWLKHLSKKYRN